MLTQPLQTIRRTTAVTILSLVVVLASFGAPAGANTGKHPRKHPQKRALGALLPKRQVDAVTPVGANAVALPPSVDLSSDDVPVGNQTKEVGSCVTWAIDYAMLGWYARHDGRADELFNPMYTYSQIHLSATGPDGGGSKPEAAIDRREGPGQRHDRALPHAQHDGLREQAERLGPGERGKVQDLRLADAVLEQGRLGRRIRR